MSTSLVNKVIALSLGKGLTTFATILSAMLMSRMLTEGQLGTFRQSLLVYDLLTNIFCLGISNGVYFFLPAEKTRARGVVVDGVVVLFLMGTVSCLFLLLGGSHYFAHRFSNPDLSKTLTYIAILPVILLPAGLVSAVLVTLDKVTHLTVYNVVFNLCGVVSIILICIIWKDPSSIVLTKVVNDMLFGVIGLVLIFWSLPPDEWKPSFRTIGSLVSFSIPLGIASIFGMFQVSLDRLLVSSFCKPDEFAIYSNGAIEIPFIGIVTSSIASVIQPELRRRIAEGRRAEAIDLFRLSAEKSAVILIPTMAFLFVCAEPLMVILFSDKYIESAVPFRIYLLLLPARVVMYGSMMVALGLNRTVLYRTAVAVLVNLCLGYCLIDWFGMAGAAVATVLSTFVIACGWSLWAIAQAVPCSFGALLPYRKIVTLSGLSILASIPSFLLQWSQTFQLPLIEFVASFMLFVISLIAVALIFQNELLLGSWVQAKTYIAQRFVPQKVAG